MDNPVHCPGCLTTTEHLSYQLAGLSLHSVKIWGQAGICAVAFAFAWESGFESMYQLFQVTR